MKLRPLSTMLLLLVGCGGQSATQAVLAGSRADAAATLLVPRRDAGPACVAPGDAGCPPSPPMDGPPDPAIWPCVADRDCAVFPDLPFCDGLHCSAASATVTCVANAASQGLPSPE